MPSGNANLNNKPLPPIHQNSQNGILITPNCDKDVEPKEFLIIAGGNAEWHSLLEENFSVSYKTKNTLTV